MFRIRILPREEGVEGLARSNCSISAIASAIGVEPFNVGFEGEDIAEAPVKNKVAVRVGIEFLVGEYGAELIGTISRRLYVCFIGIEVFIFARGDIDLELEP